MLHAGQSLQIFRKWAGNEKNMVRVWDGSLEGRGLGRGGEQGPGLGTLLLSGGAQHLGPVSDQAAQTSQSLPV